jgi:hypothetical protein
MILYFKGDFMTINLLVSKGKKTWIGKIKNQDFKLYLNIKNKSTYF